MTYEEFLYNKTHDNKNYGFEPVFVPDYLFGFQKKLIEWATVKGRGVC